MYIQDVINWSNFDDDLLSFYKAIGVDMIHLDIRSGGGEQDRLDVVRHRVDHHWRSPVSNLLRRVDAGTRGAADLRDTAKNN